MYTELIKELKFDIISSEFKLVKMSSLLSPVLLLIWQKISHLYRRLLAYNI